MTTVVAQATIQTADAVPADYTTNTLYYDVNTTWTFGDVGWQTLANEVGALLVGDDPTYSDFKEYRFRTVTVKLYDLADRPAPGSHGPPAPVQATYHRVATSIGATVPDTEGTLGPRQIALVLSYYGTRNIVHERGHIYLGPFNQTDLGGVRPSDTLLSKALNLGHGLFNVGGENVKHVVVSEWNNKVRRSSPLVTPVQHYWCDDSWDTQRRRKDKASKRVSLAP